MAVLAIDVGQSGSRARLVGTGDPALDLPGVSTAEPLGSQLIELGRLALRRYPGARVDSLAIGSTGRDARLEAAELLTGLRGLGVRTLALAHDSVTSCLGALGTGTGVVVAAGTGAVTLAVGASRVARVDGWGHLLGDDGSGYWIGRAGLAAVLRAHDGRGPSTALTAVVGRDFPDLERAYLELQSDPARVARISGYAKVITELAGADAVCLRIVQQAAAELASSALTALRRVAGPAAPDPRVAVLGGSPRVAVLGGSPRVAVLGGLFGSALLLADFEAAIRAELPGARLLTDPGTSLDGAARLLDCPDDHPLRAMISIARD